MDVWLIIVTCIIAIILIISNIYWFILYSHPDEKGLGSNIFYKILIISGMGLSWTQVLLLPLDISNSRGMGGGQNMNIFWKIVFGIIFLYIAIIIPFGIFLYESDEEDSWKTRCKGVTCKVVLFAFISFMLLLIFWAICKTVYLPINVTPGSTSAILLSSSTSLNSFPAASAVKEATVETELGYEMFLIVFPTFLGWFLFTMFGGIGLVAQPVDLIFAYKYRPKLRGAREMAERKIAQRMRTVEVLEMAKNVKRDNKDVDSGDGWFGKWKTGRKNKTTFNCLKSKIFELEEEIQLFNVEQRMRINPCLPWLWLIGGIFFSFCSIVLLFHIILYMLIRPNGKPVHDFFNSFLEFLEDKIASFFSIILFIAFALYQIAITITGTFKFGLRLFIFFPIHPMKKQGTWMNSFQFNVSIQLISTMAVNHFCSEALQNYSRYSVINMFYGTLLKNTKFFNFFFNYNIFIWLMLAWALFCFVYLYCCKKHEKKLDLKAKVKEYKKKALNNVMF